ncbi:NAD-dependent succinate-semialdehyde dehydrogenase [Bacillus sp. FJAT-50079]|uniref:NAD-dependent succinate-semialdehyde dehydrogenase n=1 Tax=Bacillus sp. FJAT-50079 TaxID=2833577 RepID=UPI001BC8F4D5|nr:NAD-dependent succinate-semialdehyde dehydrogenase [Bacillus sp. FJAT-50079]MBS4208213.1 NAD-dependent succinate-semialdehyde dehydrogenase [Bacillus sp. FJAT-50079]
MGTFTENKEEKMIQERILIGGEWTHSSDGMTFDVLNPATGEKIATVPKSTARDVERAVAAADDAFKSWSALTPFQRGEILRKASLNVLKNAEDIARLMSKEQGKSFQEAFGEVKKGAEILRYYAEEGERIYGRIIPNAEENMESRVIYQPIGVAAAISPWNYPIELLAWKVGAALASGCTIVCKLPSETPLSPSAFVKCMIDAGVYPGVINTLTGSGSAIGPILLNNPLVKKVAFTGSTEVGKNVLMESAKTLKKASLELGGSLPMIVCADSDLEEAVKGAVRRSFRNMGQICIAINRIYVDRSIYSQFIERFAAETKKLKINDGVSEEYDLGPMCTQKGLQTTIKHVEDAVNKGAKIVAGGKRPEGEMYKKGHFYCPTVISDVNHDMLIMQEETFGPAVGVMPYDTIEEAITLANDTSYGLAAIVYTNNLRLSDKLSKEINAGNVAINNVDAGVINAPYGGWSDSGFGHEHGPEGLYEYLQIKHIRMRM